MSLTRKCQIGVVALFASAGLAALPATAAHAVDDVKALNNCTSATTPSFTSGVFSAGGNNHTRFDLPSQMFNNDAFRISATGSIAINYWGTMKSVAGDATPADHSWPLPGHNQYMLIAKVDKGEVITNRGTRFGPGQWFPVGANSGCFRYVRTTPILPENPSAFLTLSYNDPNLGDNGGFGNVTVRQWFCVVC